MRSMQIEPGRVVTLSFDLCDQEGEIVEASDITGAISFIHGRGSIIPGLDAKLAGMEPGDEADFTFPPEEAFGSASEGPEKVVGRHEFPPEAEIRAGAEFEAGIPGGQKIKLVVTALQGENVQVRMVHPLAGQTVSMSVKVQSVRAASPQELETGKVVKHPPPPPRS